MLLGMDNMVRTLHYQVKECINLPTAFVDRYECVYLFLMR